MGNKPLFYCGGSLIVGIAIGHFFTQAYAGRRVTDTFALLQMTDIGESQRRAFQTYQHASAPVAIYALTESLDKLKDVEQTGGTKYLGKRALSIDMMLTHARLAKLYAMTGQTNLSAQNLAEALSYAKTDSNLTITNRDSLMDFVAKFDKGAK